MFARNTVGTADHNCRCEGGWRGHIAHQTGINQPHCSVVGCTSPATDGAHITLLPYPGYLPGLAMFTPHVAPMCHEHNCAKEEILCLHDNATIAIASTIDCTPRRRGLLEAAMDHRGIGGLRGLETGSGSPLGILSLINPR